MAKTKVKLPVAAAMAAPKANDNEPSHAAASGGEGATSESKSGETVPGLRVVSRPDQFRRAGITFTSNAVDIKLSDLTPEQVEAIRGERNLVVLDCLIED